MHAQDTFYIRDREGFLSPWLGQTGRREEVWGSFLELSTTQVSGCRPHLFPSAEAAFRHIQQHLSATADRLEVYQAHEGADSITFTRVEPKK